MLRSSKSYIQFLMFFTFVSFFSSVSFAGCLVSGSQTQETCERLCGRACVRHTENNKNVWVAVLTQPQNPILLKKPTTK